VGGDAAGAGGLPARGRCFCGGVAGDRHPKGWLPPFIAFGSVLVGLVWFQGWSIRHRHDDD